MEIDVLIDEDVKAPLEAAWLRSVAERVLLSEDVSPAVNLGLFITSQERVQQLNRNFRGRDEPTDVLAFAATGASEAGLLPFVSPPDGLHHLGEVIIAYPQAVAQAAEHGHPVEHEIAILIIHGVLHLLGYDHDEPERELRMKAREADILGSIRGSTNETTD